MYIALFCYIKCFEVFNCVQLVFSFWASKDTNSRIPGSHGFPKSRVSKVQRPGRRLGVGQTVPDQSEPANRMGAAARGIQIVSYSCAWIVLVMGPVAKIGYLRLGESLTLLRYSRTRRIFELPVKPGSSWRVWRQNHQLCRLSSSLDQGLHVILDHPGHSVSLKTGRNSLPKGETWWNHVTSNSRTSQVLHLEDSSWSFRNAPSISERRSWPKLSGWSETRLEWFPSNGDEMEIMFRRFVLFLLVLFHFAACA